MTITNIHLKKLTVDNYKSLKDSTIELQMGLNIIIGKNGAGKSNLLDFINTHVGGRFYRFRTRAINTNSSISFAYSSENTQNILSYTVEKNRREDKNTDQENLYNYELFIDKQENQELVVKNKKLNIPYSIKSLFEEEDKILKEFDTVVGRLKKRYIKFGMPEDVYWLSKPNRLTIEQRDGEYATVAFEESLTQLSFFLGLEASIEFNVEKKDFMSQETKEDTLLLKKHLTDIFNTHFESTAINSFLKHYTPIAEIRLNPNLSIYSKEETIIIENFSVDFLVDGDWMPWSYLSDGTKRLFYLVSECLTIVDGLILIEEPELGVHPHQLLKILDFLKEQSRTKQVIISTHSPLSLDILDEDELNRIIIATYEKGTRFHTLNEEEISKAKRYINEVGELSYYWLHSDLEK